VRAWLQSLPVNELLCVALWFGIAWTAALRYATAKLSRWLDGTP
jgi:hypothetical protein